MIISKFLKNTSFRVKIFLIIFIAIIIPTISVSTLIYIRSENAIKDQTERTITNSMDFVIGNTDSSLKAISEMSNSILTDDRLTSIVSSDGNSIHSGEILKYSELHDLLNSFSNRLKNTFMLNGIDSYYLYIPGQKTLIDSKSTYFENVSEDDVDFVKWNKKNIGKDTWFLSSPYTTSILGISKSNLKSDNFITYDNVLSDDVGKTVAILALNINIDVNFISDYLNKIQTGTLGEIITMDENGELVSHSDKNIIDNGPDEYSNIFKKIKDSHKNKGSFLLNQNPENDFVIYSSSEYTGWKYISIIPASQVLGQIWQIRKFLIIIFLISSILLMILTYLLSYIFYNPLKKIVSAMQMIENRNLDVRINDNRADEYHKVYRGFNNMVTELNSLIKDLVNEKILKKEAQIKLLQAQINPHFLYNTLESIHSIAKIKKVDEISLMVSALSKFFRISLSGGKDDVTLKEAIDLVLNYLTIQNIRFNGKIDYKINIPEELYKAVVPKLILQPIAENSIYHGIEPRKGTGILIISALSQNGEMELSIEDNGLGIKEKNLVELRKSIENENFEDSKNFALKNLNRQIKLKYGSNYGLNIESLEGKGTSVHIKLPIIYEGGAL